MFESDRVCALNVNGHRLGKGHAQAALALWNNMFEPIGRKRWSWDTADQSIVCPTDEHPYIFTWKNSPHALESLPSTSSTDNYVDMSIYRDNVTDRHDHTLDRSMSSDSNVWLKKTNLPMIVILLLIMITVAIFIVTRRKRIHQWIASQHHHHHQQQPQQFERFHQPADDDDDDDEVWNHSNVKSDCFNHRPTTDTFGQRFSLE
jgi:hypothetical protein